ncbi:hypothetical protein Tco_0924376 [Tanacetum coccineum]|uniref:Transposase (Putative), gypsy type n=1 Tax=Tanacetum coccineum TaxID=301880 RepID=A0ABQ5D4N9_9ASTR
MGRDTIQLEDTVSTIFGEYLLEFTSEYGIPEGLHHELPGPEDTIVDFPEELEQLILLGGREDIPHHHGMAHKRPKGWDATSRLLFFGDDVYPTFLNDDDWDIDLFNLISAPNTTKVKTRTRPRAAHEVPLLTATANRIIDMEDTIGTSESSGAPSAMEKSPLDFANENPPPLITEKDGAEEQVQDGLLGEIPPVENPAVMEVVPELNLGREVAAMGPLVNKRRRKKGNDEADANAPPKVLRKDHATSRPTQSTLGGKSLALMGLEAGSTFSAPVFLPISSKGEATARDPDSEKSSSFTSMVGSPGSIYRPGWGVTNNCHLDTPDVCQDMVDHIVPPRLLKKATAKIAKQDQRIQAREEEIKKLDQEIKSLRAVDTKVQRLRNQTRDLETLLEAEVDMKKAAKAKNAELTKELESLRAQFTDLQVSNGLLSQQVSTLQAQVTGEERIKSAFEEFKKYEDDQVNSRCAEMNARLDAMSIDFNEELYPHMLTAIASRRWMIGHGQRLAVMKCAESTELRQVFADVVSTRIAKALHALKDLKYPIVDQLEKLKDAPIDLVIASLYLESDSGEDTPQWIHAIAANISRAEKKKKCWVVCRTHGVGSAYHARSDGVPISVPIVAPQGLAILLADAATQTEDEASSRLLRSKSLPPMYNLDWP